MEITPKTLILSISLFLILFLTAGNSYAQTRKQRVDTVQISYFAELKKHLYPPVDSLTTKELALFTVFPEVKPNSSLRLIEKNSKFYLELRYLEKNIWVEVLTSFVQHSYKPMTLKVEYFIAPLSTQFATKVLAVFSKVKELRGNGQKIYEKGKLLTGHFDFFDGSSYNFITYINGKMESTNIQVDESDPYNTDPIESSDYIYKVKLTNIRIINDMKNGTFKESKYEIYK